MAASYVLCLLAACASIETAAAVSLATLPAESEVVQRQQGQHMDDKFSDWVTMQGRAYSPSEYQMRKDLFVSRFNAIEKFNSNPIGNKDGHRLWTASINEFADRTDAERAAVLGYRRPLAKSTPGGQAGTSLIQLQQSTAKPDLPETIDWRNLTVSKNIRNQGFCGSCWAFTVISVLEAHYEIHSAKGGPVRHFSPQQVVDCTPNPHACGGQGGCNGATVELGFDWVMKNGLASEDEVPYMAETGTCSKGAHQDGSYKKGQKEMTGEKNAAAQTGALIGMVGYHTLPSNEDPPLAEAVMKHGPVGVAVAANGWFAYSKGVFDGCRAGGVLNHAVTLYGYGKDKDTDVPYWLIRNSYGKNWGESGFIRLKRFKDEPKEKQNCGDDNDPMEGVMCKGSKTKSVELCGMCGVLYDATIPYFKGSPGPYLAALSEPPQSGLSPPSDHDESAGVPLVRKENIS
jgi:cathepsin L